MNKLQECLFKRGYKQGYSYKPATTAYFRIAEDRVPHCLLNQKPPQFRIEVAEMVSVPTQHLIKISNEAPQGWADIGFFSLVEEELVERLDELESAILTAWCAMFELSKNEPQAT